MKNFSAILIIGIVFIPGRLFAAADVVIAYANISARVSPLWITQEKGFFAKYGVNVQQIYMPGSPVMIASMAGGHGRLIQELDRSGFIDELYSTYGVR